MRMEDLSKETNRRLLDYLKTHLSDTSSAFREDVLYAVEITAPLRERTYLVRIAAELSGVDWEDVEPFAFAAELFAISALTADDVIDCSFLRSHEPTLLAKTDSSRAFLIAEYLHSIGHRALCERVPAVAEDIWGKAANEFRIAISDLLFHQYLESFMESDTSVTFDQVDKLARGRTGRLIEACLMVPAIICKSPTLEKNLSECSQWLGMAFQHRDDVLDFIGTPEVIGKPILQNLLSGQPNLVLSHALNTATDQSARTIILKYFGTARSRMDIEGKGKEIQQEILSALKSSGSLTFASQVVRDYCCRAVNALSDLPFSQAKEELVSLIDIVAIVEFPWEDV